MAEPSGADGASQPEEAELWAKLGDPLVPSCIYVATKFQVGQGTADDAATVGELARAAGVNPRLLLGVLQTLVREGFFEELPGDRFRPTPLGRRLAEPSLRQRILDRFEIELPYLSALERALRSERTAFEQVHGRSFYEFHATNPRYGEEFHRTLAQGARDAIAPLLEAVDLRRFRSVLDVGGGSGALVAGLLAALPELRGAVLDDAGPLRQAPEELARLGVTDRCQLVVGNFLEGVPTGFDLYVLRWVLCDWDDPHALTILRNCRRAMRPESRLLILEPLRDVDREAGYRRSLDFVLRLTTAGGLRSAPELEHLLGQAGLRLVDTRAAAWYSDATEAAPLETDAPSGAR